MSGSDATVRRDAIDWAIRARDPSFDAWDALADWLEADPLHAVLYDRATIVAEDAGAALVDRASPAPHALSPQRHARWFPYAVAASLVAAVGGGSLYLQAQRPALYAISTMAGTHRSIMIAKNTRIDLDGDTGITLDHNDPRVARLDRGGAVFHVTHDGANPFRVRVGDVTITDVGTVFDVEHGVTGVSIAVAEGAVRLTTPAGPVELTAGRAVTVSGAVIVQRDEDSASVGAWRNGRLDFVDVPLVELAARVTRSTGARIEVAPIALARRVSGSITIGKDVPAAFRDLALLLDLEIAQRGNVWVWSDRSSAGPS